MVQEEVKCYHCGTSCEEEVIEKDEKSFCCNGCKTVYEILSENNLEDFYAIEGTDSRKRVGTTPARFDYLDLPEVQEKLVEFSEGDSRLVSFHLPAIHCSSCVWLLERLHLLHPGVRQAQVNFQKRTARVSFDISELKLSDLAYLLSSIGYEPRINLAGLENKDKSSDKSLLYKLGVAGFAFGNIMLLSLPEYFGTHSPELDAFAPFFRYISLVLSLPVLLYSSLDYYTSAWKGLRKKHLNIDVPIALGIVVLFVRSVYEIAVLDMPGYFDSLAGLLFFLLLGKWFQRRTYDALSFDRDYKSYFPIAVTRLIGEAEVQTPIYDLKVGDLIRIRNEELIPADAILRSKTALIDSSFVTGESLAVEKQCGDKIFAGGKQKGESIELEIIKPVDQSYLTELWNHNIFQKEKGSTFKSITDKVSENFTYGLLFIATIGFIAWSFVDIPTAFYVLTAVLIVACPCALALAAPFTLGNSLLIFGKNKFYAKSADTIENMADVDTLVFDKTGTITAAENYSIAYQGKPLTPAQRAAVRGTVQHSNHPLSRQLYRHLNQELAAPVVDFEEVPGSGLLANTSEGAVKIGSGKWMDNRILSNKLETRVYIAFDGIVQGYYTFKNVYRDGMQQVFNHLSNTGFQLNVLSGDHEGEKNTLQTMMGLKTPLVFNQSPEDKLNFIAALQPGKNVMMLGDGLNDAGALQQANVGLAVADDVHAFTPACDGIVDAKALHLLPSFLKFSKDAMGTIRKSFVISFLYNVIGLSFALAGVLTPVYCAILMPISSISVVAFVTFDTRRIAKRNGLVVNN
ncbi:MAG: heavy metal translocating P-type ATPase metal-binding domain-containing protein [Schleiferiaceae bacterium]|nr:heavy metal translocating P-type ATPase metal-binding domain-containing protein [Schleiferiaceae bacterium]